MTTLGEHQNIVDGSCKPHWELKAETCTDVSGNKAGYKAGLNMVTRELCGRAEMGYRVYSNAPHTSPQYLSSQGQLEKPEVSPLPKASIVPWLLGC